jgi:hypothetical protein
MNNNNIFDNILRVRIRGQHGLTKATQRRLAQAFNDGEGLSAEDRYGCRIAVDTNEAIADGIEAIDGTIYVPNPKVRAQFGKNKRGLAYLTFGLIGPDAHRITLNLEGENVPDKMCETAIKHDMGREVATTTIAVDLSRASVYETGNMGGGKKRHDPRRNHDTGKDGKPYPRSPRPHHNRLCAKDLEARRQSRLG